MKKQIKQLIIVLSAAVIGGFLLAFLMIMYYGPTGKYIAGHAILAPEVIEKIGFNDLHPSTGKNVKFVFDHNEFVYFDYLRGEWKQRPIPIDQYARFYNVIASDSSLSEINEEILQLFQKPSPTALITTIRTDNLPAAKIFQVVQFTKENYFRVKIHEQQDEDQWAYFYHPDLYKIVIKLFTNG